jgi:Uma2 family endonuclease
MAAATQTVPALLTLEEYLQTAYHPDCDFVDGHLEERNLGDTRHSLLQMQLGFWFISHRNEWNVRVMSELRTRVSAARVRIPDVSVAYDDAAMKDRIRNVPSLIAIEILSPDDRLDRVKVRLRDFLQMGIPHIWLLDPATRTAQVYDADGLKLVEGMRITIANSPIFLDLNEIFAALD